LVSQPKYSEKNLIPMLRKAAKFINELIKAGFTDNGGAIHSAERILDILSYRIKYLGLKHINKIKEHADAEFSKAAMEAIDRGERVFIEHVAPLRALTRAIISAIEIGKSDRQLINLIKKHYRLVLLTAEETKRLNGINRSELHHDRLGQAKIILAPIRKNLRKD
jgi:hypothetical protein